MSHRGRETRSHAQTAARHDKMVELMTRMMELKKQQARAPGPRRTLPIFLSDVKARRDKMVGFRTS